MSTHFISVSGSSGHYPGFKLVRNGPPVERERISRTLQWPRRGLGFARAICYRRGHRQRSFAMSTMLSAAPEPSTSAPVERWLEGRSFASWREQFDQRGYLIFERVL